MCHTSTVGNAGTIDVRGIAVYWYSEWCVWEDTLFRELIDPFIPKIHPTYIKVPDYCIGSLAVMPWHAVWGSRTILHFSHLLFYTVNNRNRHSYVFYPMDCVVEMQCAAHFVKFRKQANCMKHSYLEVLLMIAWYV